MIKKELLKLAKESIATNMGLDELTGEDFEKDPRVITRKRIQELSYADREQVKKYQKILLKHRFLKLLIK